MRTCSNCGSDKYYAKEYCHKCYNKFIVHPKWNLVYNPIYNPRHLKFKGKQIILKENPRKGICSWCGKEGRTAMHHIEYHIEDVLKDTIELCVSCHNKTRVGMRYKK